MQGAGADWAQLARILSGAAQDLLDEFCRVDTGAKLVVTVELEVAGDKRICEVRMAGPKRDDKAAPGEGSLKHPRPDAASPDRGHGRSWAHLGARHGS